MSPSLGSVRKLCWTGFLGFAGQGCARLADSGLRPVALHRTFDHSWVVCPGFSVLVPIGLHAVTALVALTVSSGFILAPPPYRMVNAGSCDYKKKKKKEHELLTEGSHYNFPKMHLLSHFTEQILKYGSLPQFCSNIS